MHMFLPAGLPLHGSGVEEVRSKGLNLQTRFNFTGADPLGV